MKLRRRVVALALPMALVAVVGLALAWENRGSEKVVTAVLAPLVLAAAYYFSRWFLPGSEKWVTAGLVALVASLGILAFTPPLHFKRVMTATFLMRADDREPIFSYPFQTPVTVAAANAPHDVWAADKDGGIRVYHHLLQRAILEALLSPELGWGTEVERYSNWGAIFRMKKGATIPAAQIAREFAANRFMTVPFMQHTVEGPALTVPAGTTISGNVPDEHVPGNEIGHIRLHHRLYSLTIETHMLSSSSLLHGRYALITTGRDTNPSLASATYRVGIIATGTRLFPYHPEMPKYMAWMQAIADGLARTFDDEERWKVIMESQTARHLILVPLTSQTEKPR